jgi:ABC-type branched-subunit amino acid transport system substrate-binding protein
MQSKRTKRLVNVELRPLVIVGLVSAGCIVGCNSIIGLDQFSISESTGQAGGAAGNAATGTAGNGGTAGTGGAGGSGGSDLDASSDASEEPRVVECRTNRECTDRATLAAMTQFAEAGPPDGSDGGPPGTVPAMCVQSIGKCVELLSVDCQTITGDYVDDNAVLLGTLFTTSGAQGSTNLQRQQSATLAFEEVNSKGGLPPRTAGGPRRPIVVLSCNEANPVRAATHLIDDLHVSALVGPNTSQDTITLSQMISIKGDTVMMTPSAVASSIADLEDKDLTWLMAPSDVQRAPLMIQQINEIETTLKVARGNRPLKLGIIYRNDALGQGTQTALIPLTFNGASLTAPSNVGKVFVDAYQPTAPNQDALVAKYRDNPVDIIAIAGTAEAITTVMVPLENTWNAEASADRPYYVTIDSAKVPELLAAVACSLNAASAQCTLTPKPANLPADLRARIRGTGITPTADAAPVLTAFQLAYKGRYGVLPTASSTGPSYDAAYAISYAIAAVKDLPVTGANIAMGLRKLAGGSTVIEVGSTKILAAFQRLGAVNDAGPDSGVDKITAIGTFNPLEWDEKGAPVSATLEMWCIGAPGGTPAYATSGLFYDLKTKMPVPGGTFTQCP